MKSSAIDVYQYNEMIDSDVNEDIPDDYDFDDYLETL